MDDNSGDVVMRGSTLPITHDQANYGFSGKVMMASVITLAVICIVIAFFHVYARRLLLRVAASHHINRPAASTTIAASVLPPSAAAAAGLDQSTIKSIPTFIYSSTTHKAAPLECSICLSEFERNETGRILPKCNHCFHLDCIDMWFHSHSNCPLCRGPVQSVSAQNQNLPESPAGNFSDEQSNEDFSVIIDVLATGVSGGSDPVSESESANGFKSMFEPIRSLRRLLSM